MSIEENIVQQRALYGEPLGDLVRRTAAALGLTQAAMAKVLGLSPAMLSHLVTGQRVKVANPVTLTRLRALVELADHAPGLTAADLQQRLDGIGTLVVDLTTSQQVATEATDGPALLRSALRAVASGRELAAAVTALAGTAPDLAELIRVYGTGTEAEMRVHWANLPR
ncbi:helix-turn-helix transcriptional regulator [Nocardioides sp. AE5]|uniref:helix-turn-helix transcriptional regulator n=1 Tax=Nocardioides sp. AE5 TaxID=2962573 RepID=UPI0028826560|nr:helix-turn-helix transcriptional regulator [Nocardioides sp. AE5]MDT0201672.1 helix-turn-helix transcriptional regulator [Nocardioides sp. AE5]